MLRFYFNLFLFFSPHISTADNFNGIDDGYWFRILSIAGPGGESNYHFKTLVPAVAAGAIIGKGGETIAALQKETNARVKMSKSHDFYPGEEEII